VVLLIAAWEIVGHYVPPIFLAPFHKTLVAFYAMGTDGSLLRATLSTLSVLLLGLAISAVLGIAIGLALGRYPMVRWIIEPYANGLYAAPTIAFLPLITLWLGLYLAPKVAIVVLIAIFPILKNTFAGVATVNDEYLEPAASMRASELQVFGKVIIPATLPFIIARPRLPLGPPP